MVSTYLVTDPAGHALRMLRNATTELQKLPAERLAGDGLTIDGAILALLIVRERIHEIQPASGILSTSGVSSARSAADQPRK